MSHFNKFNFDEKILKILQERGYETPTPIQELTIPKILTGVDIIASAQTGTGKTAAFMLPILQLLSQPLYKGNVGPQVLILVPTRELAMQVADEAKKFGKYLPKIKTVCIYGGVPYPLQRKALASRYEILVATPGRLMDHMAQGRIDLSHVKLFVLDEADRMLDMGFFDAVEEISKALPYKRQTLLFSATLDQKILPFSKKLQKDAHEIKAQFSQTVQNNIEQRLYYVDNIGHKMRLLEHILENTEINQSIVFTSTIQQANELAYHLQEKGYPSEALHGDMNQRQRSRTINRLRGGEVKFLIATDVASRGIDIASLSHIINFDLPFVAEDFIHRIGRTGRAGAKGVAITFSTYKEELKLTKIHKLLGKSLEPHTIDGMGPKPKEAKSSGSYRQKPRSSFKGSSAPRKPESEGRYGSPKEKPYKNGSMKPRSEGRFGYSSPKEKSSQDSFIKPRSEGRFGYSSPKEKPSQNSFMKPRSEGRFGYSLPKEKPSQNSFMKPKREVEYSSSRKKSNRFEAPFSKAENKPRKPRLFT